MSNWWLLIPTSIIAVLTVGAALLAAGKWIGSTNKSVKTLEGFMREIRDDVKRIFAKIGPPLTSAQSPVRLTKLGDEIANSLGAFAWAAEAAKTLAEGVEGKKPFEVDQEAARYVRKVVGEKEWRDKIAECAYQRGLKAEDLTVTLHIPLRDELLRLTGQSPEDLDTTEEEAE